MGLALSCGVNHNEPDAKVITAAIEDDESSVESEVQVE